MNILTLIWNSLLYQPILWALLTLSGVLFGNLGLGIIALTLIIRTLLVPLTLPSLKAMQKQRDIQGELSELKSKYKDDKKRLAEEQMKLFQKHGINPAAGCLPQLLQIIILIAMYNAFTTVLNKSTHGLATSFLYLDLTKPDPFIILPGLSGAAQFWASKLMLPTVKKEEKLAEKTADKSDDIMYNMQEQMLYLAPLMTILIGFKLPSGLVLYWFVTTVFSLIQQIWVNNTYGKNART